MRHRMIRFLCALAIVGFVPAARAQHKHGDEKSEEHGKPAVFTMPTTYKAAVEEIEHRLHEISELIEDRVERPERKAAVHLATKVRVPDLVVMTEQCKHRFIVDAEKYTWGRRHRVNCNARYKTNG